MTLHLETRGKLTGCVDFEGKMKLYRVTGSYVIGRHELAKVLMQLDKIGIEWTITNNKGE